MKILFWGTPAYALPSLNALVDAGHDLVGVVSQPDRRRRRGKELVASPIKARALELGISVFTPERIRTDLACQKQLADLGADAYVVVAFGQILPPAVLAQPPLGCWNGHGSLLPRWRGAGPIQWCLLEGDSQTGVGVMAMEEGLDTGPVLLERSLPIGLLDNAHQLADGLAALTGSLLVQALPLIEQGGLGSQAERWARLGLQSQAEQGMTYARQLVKDDFLLDWSQSGLSLHRKVMGLYPRAHSHWAGKRLKLLATEPLVHRLRDQLSPEARPLADQWGLNPNGTTPPQPESKQPAPGTVLAIEPAVGLVIATGGCPLLLRSGQLEGKAPSAGQSLIQQLSPSPGQQLG
jgi:methionyl-tRNA formyltransferase